MLARTRQRKEQLEVSNLSPLASFSARSKGRAREEEPDRYRTCFEQDRDRILHSKSFRRLANKTQVFLAPEGDHFRTRLTHTLEVGQISRDCASALGLNTDLTEAIVLGHDLGHTPFGHIGERALSQAMRDYRSAECGEEVHGFLFRHAEQSVRIVEVLEKGGRGLNLSFETVDGIKNHGSAGNPSTLEGKIVQLADRIAYVTHDIDDAKRAGLLTEADIPTIYGEVLGHSSSERIETMVEDLIETSADADDICMSEGVFAALLGLRSFMFKEIYTSGDAKSEEPKAYSMLITLFNYYLEHMDEVPNEYKLRAEDSQDVQIADYISSMTDRYAIRMYKELFVPKAWAGGLD